MQKHLRVKKDDGQFRSISLDHWFDLEIVSSLDSAKSSFQQWKLLPPMRFSNLPQGFDFSFFPAAQLSAFARSKNRNLKRNLGHILINSEQMPRKTKKPKHVDAEIDNKDWLDLTSDEGVCLICCSVLNEPIQLPCRCRTRMKCTMCRVCFKRMVDDNASECRSACPVCGQRLLNWMRGVSKDERRGQRILLFKFCSNK